MNLGRICFGLAVFVVLTSSCNCGSSGACPAGKDCSVDSGVVADAGAVDSGNPPVVVDAGLPKGTLALLAGTPGGEGAIDGVGASARFRQLTGVVVASTGEAFAVDNGNHCIRKIATDGTVTTFAGALGKKGYADGAAGTARFDLPTGIAISSDNTLYVTDTKNHVIRTVKPDGTVATLAGQAGVAGNTDGAGSQALFTSPLGIAVDATGTVFVAANGAIRSISKDGMVATIAGKSGEVGSVDGTAKDARFGRIYGLAVSPTGALYLADFENFTIRSVTAGAIEKVVSTVAGRAGEGGSTNGMGPNARFSFPRGLVVLQNGALWVADSFAIRQILPATGEVTTVAGTLGAQGSLDGAAAGARFQFVLALTVDSAGAAFAAELNSIRKFAAGQVTTVAGAAAVTGLSNGLGSMAQFGSVTGMASDTEGNVYTTEAQGLLADVTNTSVRKITPQGLVSSLAGKANARGTENGLGELARFVGGGAVTVNRAGEVYVAEEAFLDNYRAIRKVSPVGLVTTLVTGSSMSFPNGSDGLLARPADIVIDSEGNLYVADTGASTIRKVTPDGTVSVLAGQVGSSGQIDGTGSNARLSNPGAMAIAPNQTIYFREPVALTNEALIRSVTLTGEVRTVGKVSSEYSSIAVDPKGNLFLLNQGACTISKFNSLNDIVPVVGRPGECGNVFGELPAQLAQPRKFAFLPSGQMVISTLGAVLVTKEASF